MRTAGFQFMPRHAEERGCGVRAVPVGSRERELAHEYLPVFFHKASKTPQGFGLRQSSGAFPMAATDPKAPEDWRSPRRWRDRGSADNPKGIVSFSPGLRGTSYPGSKVEWVSTPTGLCHVSSATPQPRWGCMSSATIPKVARSSQPWAGRWNLFG